MREQLRALALRLEEIEAELAQPETYGDPEKLAKLNREQKELAPLVEAFCRYEATERELQGLTELLSDPEYRDLARGEYDGLKVDLVRQEEALRQMLIPKDPMDGKDVILEIRAGVGGEEAALFAANLYRMYTMYGEKQGWRWEIASVSETELGGMKEVSCLVAGENAYARLKHESGVHRVQRVPETESGGRIHTSTCTVAVLPQVDEVEFHLDPNDLRIDTFRSSGAGGQHINKTESAIRITHLPTGTVVECQDQRSQYKNKDRAMSILRARLYERAVQEREAEIAGQRRSQVGTGMRNERIRTYNFPQGRVTDHRIGLTLYKLDGIMNGDLDEIIDGLVLHEQAERQKGSE
ncbi:MAG: peptide chain release factor 1 [Evtepia sp.]|uniref:peptide chain release factor 1 n=1 Tax=Evtepia sp. TaxID=2773933 RepID=UPI002A75CB93|nr:peptide chain release factor 1 [Evtepia sp.]MDY3014094.1 peptide chain release factor 1 [Evtepia sp.]